MIASPISVGGGLHQGRRVASAADGRAGAGRDVTRRAVQPVELATARQVGGGDVDDRDVGPGRRARRRSRRGRRSRPRCSGPVRAGPACRERPAASGRCAARSRPRPRPRSRAPGRGRRRRPVDRVAARALRGEQSAATASICVVRPPASFDSAPSDADASHDDAAAATRARDQEPPHRITQIVAKTNDPDDVDQVPEQRDAARPRGQRVGASAARRPHEQQRRGRRPDGDVAAVEAGQDPVDRSVGVAVGAERQRAVLEQLVDEERPPSAIVASSHRRIVSSAAGRSAARSLAISVNDEATRTPSPRRRAARRARRRPAATAGWSPQQEVRREERREQHHVGREEHVHAELHACERARKPGFGRGAPRAVGPLVGDHPSSVVRCRRRRHSPAAFHRSAVSA